MVGTKIYQTPLKKHVHARSWLVSSGAIVFSVSELMRFIASAVVQYYCRTGTLRTS